MAAPRSPHVPDLGFGEGSWIVSNRRTGERIVELFTRMQAEAAAGMGHRVETPSQYRARLQLQAAQPICGATLETQPGEQVICQQLEGHPGTHRAGRRCWSTGPHTTPWVPTHPRPTRDDDGGQDR